MLRLLTLGLLLTQAAPLSADVVSLLNGDRVTGKVVDANARRIRLQTPYGLLSIPRERVARVERDDGTVETVNAPVQAPTPTPPPPPPPEPARLHLVVSGDSFWQAWDPKTAPLDPSLRLELKLDDRPLAFYTDVTLDPEDLPKAVVNSFVFSTEQLLVQVAEGVVVSPPLVAGNEIGLALKIPARLAGAHQLQLSYEVNDGSSVDPSWRPLVTVGAPVTLAAGETTRLRVEQSRGTMQYARRRMSGIETFVLTLHPDTDAAAPAP